MPIKTEEEKANERDRMRNWPKSPRQEDRRAYHIRDAQADNGAKIQRREWNDPLDCYGLSARQREAGRQLRDLWSLTQKGRDESKGERVDTTPDWAEMSVKSAQAVTDYAKLAEHIPYGCKRIVEAVICHDNRELPAITHAALAVALDCIANELRL